MTNLQLKQFTSLVKFLSQVLGPDYEIVLQDLSDSHNCVAAIENGSISGRKIGSPITDAALRLLKKRVYETTDFVANYKGVTRDGIVLRSSTFFFKDENNEPFALLCINFSDARYIELHDKLLALAHPITFLTKHSTHTIQESSNIPDFLHPANVPSESDNITETFMADTEVLMEDIYNNVVSNVDFPLERLTQYEREKIVELLREKGIFKLKGAVPFVADKINCSVASVYRYLGEIK